MAGSGTFRRRDAQLSSVTLLSQLQIFLMGHVLLLPAWPWSHKGRWEDPTRTDPRTWVEVPQSQSPGRWHCPAFLGVNCAVIWMPEHHQHSRPSTSSTLLTSPTPNSLPVSLQPLLPSCAPLSPHALLSSPLPSSLAALAAPNPPASTSYISGLPTLPPHYLFFHAWTFTPITAGNPQAQPGSWSPIFP